jgi:hypothetical protein
MTDLFTALPEPKRVATLTDLVVDLFVRRITDAELTKRRRAGEYDNLRAQDLAGYHAMARGN